MTIRKLTLIHYTDPGHGWLKVPKRVLAELDYLKEVSSYSYERNNHVYLEEDKDATGFLKLLESKNIKYKIRGLSTNKQSKIRSYRPVAAQPQAVSGASV